MKLVLEKSVVDASATTKQRNTPNHSPGNPQSNFQLHLQSQKDSRSNRVSGSGGNGSEESAVVTPAKKKREKSSVERVPPEAGRVFSWVVQGRSEVLAGRDPS